MVSKHPSAEEYRVLTFDCYGTLVDWGSGIVENLQRVVTHHNREVSDQYLLEFFAQTEPQVQSEGGRYVEVLGEVLRRLGQEMAFTPSAEELDGFGQSVGEWKPFADTVDALTRLSKRFDLAIISNVDNDLFARTNRRLKVTFSHIITAEEVSFYKPDRAMFDAALATLGGKTGVLHVAQSLFHDIAPASALGIDTVWIRRDHNAARVVDAQPTWSYATLGDFADAILGNQG
ncbi:MAG: haloacid dehalogenase type II [Actinomycetia bacterium]|nr:haloacid dehalogenase type II [Actinomycetes bacterium]